MKPVTGPNGDNPTVDERPSREVHLGCGGTVVLRHEVWQCTKCKRKPMSIFDTKTEPTP